MQYVFSKFWLLPLVFFVLTTTSCHHHGDFYALVPATVDQNPDLPSLAITVDGQSRLVHYRTFGDATNPVLFVVHGSMSDMRPYLPLSVLSDRYFVVMWDMRGNGLSERCPAHELEIEDMVEEIHTMKQVFSPDTGITVLGHSWSAVFVSRYLAQHPEAVSQAVLIEPNGLKDTFMEEVGMALNLFSDGYMDMMYTNAYMTADDHESLDYQGLQMLTSGVRDFFCDPDNLPPWPVWRVGAYALIQWEKSILQNGKMVFDYTDGLDQYPNEVLLVGTECSPIGYAFQEKYHLPLFQKARVLRIENSGHRLLTERLEPFISGLKTYLRAYN